MMRRNSIVACIFLLMLMMRPPTVRASEPLHVSMQPERWTALEADAMGPKGVLGFSRQEGFPDGLMTLNGGSASIRGLNFAEGTIEYDFKPIGEEAPGIQFRVAGDTDSEDAEEVYFRISKDCRTSNDCVQYTPVIHGFMLWDIYPQYQHQGFLLDGWNHVRLVVSRHRLQVFLNQISQPALDIGELESASTSGSIHLRGSAVYANLSVTRGAPSHLAAPAEPDLTLRDAGIVRQWRVSNPIPISTLSVPSLSDMPHERGMWATWVTERGGLLNLNRHYFAGKQPAAFNWLTFSVQSRRKTTKRVSLGWVGEAWVFANGKLVQDAKNFYYPETERKFPDGRFSLSNSSFDLTLQSGSNQIVIALYAQVRDAVRTRTKYGWGIAMRFADMDGLHFDQEGSRFVRSGSTEAIEPK